MKRQLLIMVAALIAICAAAQPKLTAYNIDEVLSAMTLQEKASLLVGGGKEFTGRYKGLPAGSTRAIERFGIPMTFLADGPAGVRVNHPCTGFPVGSLIACSWNTGLIEEMASAMGKEAFEYGVDLILAPGLNIHRNPLCGRNFEYFSEDPVLSGKLAAAYVRGIQSQGVGATVKHFAVNNQETLRTTLDARVGERALREIYLKGFEIAVKESAPWSVMASYNQLNGDYTQQKKWLLTEVLRDEWSFDGIVMTDWGFKDGTVKAVWAGNDLMEPGREAEIERIVTAVENGNLDMADVDRNVRRMLEYVVKTPSYKQYPRSGKPDLAAHAALARRVASESVVLLKNEDDLLPLKNGQCITLCDLSGIGFVAGGTGSGSISKSGVINMQTALAKSGFVLTEDSDVVVAVLGRSAGEENDRHIKDDFELTSDEQNKLKELCNSGKKVVVVLNICGVVETASWKALPDAIILPWAPGREGAYAIADILSGKVNPSGKLSMTFPVNYWDDPSASNFPSDSSSVKNYTDYKEGIYVGYRHYTTKGKDVSYPFGFGLSYTTFKYSQPKVKCIPDGLEIQITVTNTGRVSGKESVQVYVGAPSGGLDKPLRELKGFAKTGVLAPGQKEVLVFHMKNDELASFNENTSSWETAKGKYTIQFGASVEDIRVQRTIKL